MEDMAEGIKYAHKHNVKVYVTANIIAHNEDLIGLEKYFKELEELRADAVIVAIQAYLASLRKLFLICLFI